MSNKNSYAENGILCKEIVRTFLERMQGERLKKRREREIPEPEKISPKAKYEVEDILNNAYMNRDEVPLAMDIFKPVVDEDTELPVIVVIHGGGLVIGDRKMSRVYARSLASRGYLVFSIEYRLAPRANACEQLDDVCAGMDCIGRRLVDFNVDFSRMFLTAESAGAYLATYVAAMKNSEKLQEAIGYEPTKMYFHALGLHCGMFYTELDDPIGWLLADQLYGDKEADENFRQYLDPEHEEIIKNLPPVFLTTSRGDFLNNYTLMYHDALKKAGRKSHLMYFGSDDLNHAFVATEPYRSESIDAIDRMVDWFEEQAEQYQEDLKRFEAEKEALNEINKRIENGEIIEQKSWKFIRELNSYSRDRLDSVALDDGRREYTYRQMFRKWERYAEVFSALGLTGKDHSRVMMRGMPSSEIISAMYALNMTGASVSLIREQSNDMSKLRDMAKRENITDLILPDCGLSIRQLKKIRAEKDDLGIRNIIVIHIPLFDKTKEEWEERESIRKYKEMKKISDVLFFDDLLKKYEATPICYSEECRDDAFIIHTSGTTTGKRKSVPVSDRGLNESARRMLADPRYEELRNSVSSCLFMELSIAYAMFDMLNLPLAFGGKVIVYPNIELNAGKGSVKIFKAIMDCRPNILFTLPHFMKMLMEIPVHPDLSFIELIFAGGGYISADTRRRFDKYLKKCGAKTGVTIGYGNSEAGAAVIVSDADRKDDAIGYPLPGVKIKLFDEDRNEFKDPADGPCRGVMHICSPSISSGRLDDKVLFELVDIDGEKYLNTYDMVEVREDGAYYFIGRMNKYFINNEGVRFDAGPVERALSAQPEIEDCGIAPRFSRIIRDTVPSLYLKIRRGSGNPAAAARKALKEVFIGQDLASESYLPFDLTITKDIPYNDGGKVDVYKITTEKISGIHYGIVPVRENGVLKDIRLEKYDFAESDKKAMTKDMKKHYDE